MALAPATRLGPYEIGARIGAGGMGEVYAARDTYLGRNVAIKVLPDAFAQDPDRLARFEREARTLAALNHPNIATVHGFEKSDGILALVMELVAGPTLADRLGQGPIALDEALPIALQIAAALEAAHEQGIVHRDLKPANVKVRSDGTVKVLDFGLAKVIEPLGATSSVSHSPTITTPALTQAHVILGTAAYMSPEQAKGRAADQRSDVWAFGCVLYQILTGRQAFAGEDVVETLGAVIHKNADWTALPPDTPAAIRRLLTRCLQKDRAQRIPHMGAARLEIQDAINDGPRSFVESPDTRPRSHGWIAWAVAAFLLLVLFAVAAAWWLQPPLEPPIYRASILPLADAPLVGLPPGRFTLSPNGQYLAFTSGRPGTPNTLWVRSLTHDSARQLAGTEGAAGQFWSPDSRFVGFFAQGKLKKVDITGGPPIALTDADTGATAGSWNQDGVIVFPRLQGGLYRIDAGGGMVTAVTSLDEAAGDNRHWWPWFFPDGKHFLYEAIGSGSSGNDPRAVYIGSLDPNEQKQLLLNGGSNAKYADGYLLFMRDTTLMAQRFDTRRLALRGEPLPVAENVDVGGSTRQSGAFTVSATGTLVYETAQPDSSSTLVWLDRSGKQVGEIPQRAARGNTLELSPDGTRAAVAVFESARAPGDIWIVDLVRGTRQPLTRGERDESRAIWSSDGTRIIFNARAVTTDLVMKPSSGAESEQTLLSDSYNKAPLSWSHDGRFVLYVAATRSEADLWVLPLSGDRKPFPYMHSPFAENGARFSPDDHWVAFGSTEAGSPHIYVAPFPETGTKELVSAEDTMPPGVGARWRGDGRELFYVSRDGMLMAIDVDTTGPRINLGRARQLFKIPGSGLPSFDVSHDGSRFLFKVDSQSTSSSPGALTLMTNWPAALAKP
jgi:serine/threonine protein kinase/Tol biopolymer transport system component